MVPPISKKAVRLLFSLAVMAGISQASAATVLIDLGAAGTQTNTDTIGRSWNNVTNTAQPTAAAPLGLFDTTNVSTGVTLSISSTVAAVNKFSDSNPNGDPTPKGNAAARNYPGTATQDNLYGYSTASGGTFATPGGPVTLTLSGFTAGQRYDFFGFATRNSNDNRSELLSFQGAGTSVDVVYDPGSNTTGLTFASGDVVASSGGQILLTVGPTAGNGTANQFFYLGVLEFSQAVPEPATVSLLALGAGAGAVGFIRRRRANG